MKKEDIFIFDTEVKVQRGDLLISEPFLQDANFQRTVVLIADHSETLGTIGYVLSDKTNVKISEIIEEASYLKSKVLCGGPVMKNTLHIIYKDINKINGSKELIEGKNLYWGIGDMEKLITLLNTKQITDENSRFFVGYSGWDVGQLDDEIKQKSWAVYKGDIKNFIFNTNPKELWSSVLKCMGGKYEVISKFPKNPNLN